MDLKRKDEETDLSIRGRLGVIKQNCFAKDKIAQDRMDSQEDIAQLRANVNLSKAKKVKKWLIRKHIRLRTKISAEFYFLNAT